VERREKGWRGATTGASNFVQGVAQLFCFPSLNTYCPDVMQAKGRSAEVVAGNYMIRYIFAAAGSAVVLPAVEKVGVGWFSVISCGFLPFSTSPIVLTTIYGERWKGLEGLLVSRECY
jgi:hypothetical protein